MSSLLLGGIVFVCVIGAALAGGWLRDKLPTHHLSSDSKDAIRLSTAIIGTLTALALGLLIASAKNAYDDAENELRTSAARIVLLDRVMVHYGPETRPARQELRRLVEKRLGQSWTVRDAGSDPIDIIGDSTGVESVQDALRALVPANDGQRWLKDRALGVSGEVAEAHWLLVESETEGLPGAFVIVLVFWLALLFVSFGLLAPGNSTVLTTLLLCGLSVAGAVFVIADMDQPYQGLIYISDAPLREALSQLGKS
ncbi:DUF4239 domain-containing protein [Mesorhizobium sp. LHD-90]|uniref:bestrophin-like domain n=1 Tax=Mesorhizobium sp. LHD-90 TaxID=3071414 RepID=UPI0027E00073|nr:DUF4239 domain-containing protein [Mesorhizobium sp. LHD-90]MDQ6432630.1 DUF4239 domain-containing protein [Mesorhizobium sp. LHD-90]